MAKLKLEGGKELQALLLQLSQKEAKKLGRAALRKAARAIEVAAEARVPVKTAALRRAIRVRVDQGRDRSWLFASIDVKKPGKPRQRKTDRQSTVKGVLGPAKYDYQIGSAPEVYGAFQEFGAPAHGMPARPFMRPAWDAEGGQTAVDRIGEHLGKGFEAAATAGKIGGK